MKSGKSSKKEFKPPSNSETNKLNILEELSITGDEPSENYILRGGGFQALAIHPQDFNKIYTPKPPEGHEKPEVGACVRKTSPADEVKNTSRETAAHPVTLEPDRQLPDYTGPGGFRFDDQGMILPHTVLGSLEDFRTYLEAKGETELVKRIPKAPRDPPSEATGRHHSEAVEDRISSGHRNIQSNALQHWNTHMRHRRWQQDFLSDLLDRPVEDLLMNQANHFRGTQEQRDALNQATPLIHSGHGYRVGSEFWSLPQRFGDEVSGITATLTKTERGRREPVTHVGQPNCIRQESGLKSAATLRPASRTWDQSAYLQHRCQELGDVLQDMDFKLPDISRLEVIGSGKTFIMRRSPLLEKQEEGKKQKEITKENLDPPAQRDDVQSDVLRVPALRFCGELARWTGNSPANQAEVGISATIFFEAVPGERASSHLELHNEGSAVIFYNWWQLPIPQSFPNLCSRRKNPHFYFNCSSGVIHPGGTQRVEFIFKSEDPGIRTELWQLNTHPMLLQGASLQVTLRGVALYQDKTADQRLFLEKKLEKAVTAKTCRSIVYEMLRGVRSPERPSSPAERYITEEQEFLSKNPKLQYRAQPVDELKTLWQEVNQGSTWNLSVDTLRQVVLSLPDEGSDQISRSRDESLAQLNSVLLRLSEPSVKHHHVTAVAIGEQLWRKLLDMMADEAERLRNLLSLPDRETWINTNNESIISDAEPPDNLNQDEKAYKEEGASAKEGKSGVRSRIKDDKKGQSPTSEKSLKVAAQQPRNVPDVSQGKQRKDSAPLVGSRSESICQEPPAERTVDPQVKLSHARLLHSKVYALLEDLVDNLCDLMEERSVVHEQTHS